MSGCRRSTIAPSDAGYLPLKLVQSDGAGGLKEAGEMLDIDKDVYGAAVFSVTFDFFEMLSGKDHDGLGICLNVFRVIFILFLLVCNYVLQLGMLYWVYIYVALPAVHEAQTVYRNYHAQVFEKHEGKLAYSPRRWAAWDGVDELCGLAFANFWFMYAILCLWWILMLTEIRKTERMWRKFRKLPNTPDAAQMIIKQEGEGTPNCVVKLTCTTRVTLYLFLLLPKLIIALVLTVVGTVWLTASLSFSDLILNSVALEFIICIDEILFEGLLPESMKSNLCTTKMVIATTKKGKDLESAKKHEAQVMGGYHRSTIYCVLIIGGVYLFMTYGQDLPVLGVFPGYMNDAECPIWWEKKTALICKFGEECFPFIDNRGRRLPDQP